MKFKEIQVMKTDDEKILEKWKKKQEKLKQKKQRRVERMRSAERTTVSSLILN